MSIEFRNVGFHYDRARPVLKNLSFSVASGEFLLVVGQNGAGKSTLLKLMNGILKPVAGAITVNGLQTSENRTSRLAREICVTFQNPADQIFASTLQAEVEFGPKNLHRTNSEALVRDALEITGLIEHASHHPYDLPPAQRKLLTVASAYASGSPFLAFDEPSAGLSQIERSVFTRLLGALGASGRGLIVVSHDLGLLLPLASKVLILADGNVVFYGESIAVMKRRELLRKAGLRLPMPFRLREMFDSM